MSSSNIYTLTMLGTDTYFSPDPGQDGYIKGETLSYLSTLVDGTISHYNKGTLKDSEKLESPSDKASEYIPAKDDANPFRTDVSDVIVGPTTLGTEVGERIALGLMRSLEAIAKGQTTINIMAHSRGAVETILLTHELYRIQQALADDDSLNLIELVKQSPCPHTKKALENLLSKGELKDKLEAIKANISKVEANCFCIDPVPGGSIYGVRAVRWHDDRFYQVPPIIKHYEQYVYENEHTRCFKPIVPKPMDESTHFELHNLPGHHGTGSGNFSDQQFRLATDQGTHLVQKLTIFKLIKFLQDKGTKLNAPKIKEITDDVSTPLAVYAAQAMTLKSQPQWLEQLIAIYKQIANVKQHFKAYDETSYAYLGQEEGVAKFIYNFLFEHVKDRVVHYHEHSDTYLKQLFPSITEDFINLEHMQSYLDKIFKIPATNESPSNVLRLVADRLFSVKGERESYDPSASITFTNLVFAESEEKRTHLAKAITMLLDNIAQSYIRNHLSLDERQELLKATIYLFNKLYETKEKVADKDIKVIEEYENQFKNQLIMTLLAKQREANKLYAKANLRKIYSLEESLQNIELLKIQLVSYLQDNKEKFDEYGAIITKFNQLLTDINKEAQALSEVTNRSQLEVIFIHFNCHIDEFAKYIDANTKNEKIVKEITEILNQWRGQQFSRLLDEQSNKAFDMENSWEHYASLLRAMNGLSKLEKLELIPAYNNLIINEKILQEFITDSGNVEKLSGFEATLQRITEKQDYLVTLAAYSIKNGELKEENFKNKEFFALAYDRYLSIKEEDKSLKEQIDDLHAKAREQKQRADDLVVKLDELDSINTSQELQIDSQKEEITELKEKIEAISSALVSAKEDAKQKKHTHKSDSEKLSEKLKVVDEQIKAMEQKLKTLSQNNLSLIKQNKALEQENQHLKLINTIQKTVIDYQQHCLSHARFSFWHRHGSTGIKRATAFLLDAQSNHNDIDDLNGKIIDYLINGGGNLNPHSFRPMLLKALLDEQNKPVVHSLKEIADANFDVKLASYAKSLGIDLDKCKHNKEASLS
jgi:hypothetical protein